MGLTKYELSVLEEMRRRTHKRIDGGARTENDLWIPRPGSPPAVNDAIGALVRDGLLHPHPSQGRVIIARYLGWSRNPEVRRPDVTLDERRMAAVMQALRADQATNHSRPVNEASRHDLAQTILAHLKALGLIDRPSTALPPPQPQRDSGH